MSYDPFARGPHPVGVRTLSLSDAARGNRALPAEVWYPAADVHAGRDLDPATQDTFELIPGFPTLTQDAVRDATPRTGRYPVILFSHGYGSHRRQSTFLCTHLASHGYVVGTVDHTGNTMLDVMRQIIQAQSGGELPPFTEQAKELASQRQPDMSFLLDALLGGEFAAAVDGERVGITGHSFGGWTTIVTTAHDRRIRAAVPLAPAGGSNPLSDEFSVPDDHFAWGRDVPTLYIVADRDTLLPLRGIRELFDRTRSPKRMVVLRNADHMHFCDRVEEIHEIFRAMPMDRIFEPIRHKIPPITELCPGSHTLDAIRGLALAHFDAHLRGSGAAAAVVRGDVAARLGARGIAVDVVDADGAAQSVA
jgi:predicted dienelactone hydrolase